MSADLVAQVAYAGVVADVVGCQASDVPAVQRLADKAAAALIDLCLAVEAAGEVVDLEARLAVARAKLEGIAPASVDPPADVARPGVWLHFEREGDELVVRPAPADQPAAQHICGECHVGFVSAQGLGAHRSSKHPAAQVRCNDCGRIFATTAGLGGHRRSCAGRTRVPPVPPVAPAEEAENIPADIPAPAMPESKLWDEILERAQSAEPLGDVSAAPMPPAPHPMLAVCGCGHTQRRHDDGGGCFVGDCECTCYSMAVA